MKKQIYAVLKIDFDNGVTYVGKPILTDPGMKSYEKRMESNKRTFRVFETLEEAEKYYREEKEKAENHAEK